MERSWRETAAALGWPVELQSSLNEDVQEWTALVSESPAQTNAVQTWSEQIAGSETLSLRLTVWRASEKFKQKTVNFLDENKPFVVKIYLCRSSVAI